LKKNRFAKGVQQVVEEGATTMTLTGNKYDWTCLKAEYLSNPLTRLSEFADAHSIPRRYFYKKARLWIREREEMNQKALTATKAEIVCKTKKASKNIFERIVSQLEKYLHDCEDGGGNIQIVYGIAKTLKDMNMVPENQSFTGIQSDVSDKELLKEIMRVRPNFLYCVAVFVNEINYAK
jgi:hypothetical protein